MIKFIIGFAIGFFVTAVLRDLYKDSREENNKKWVEETTEELLVTSKYENKDGIATEYFVELFYKGLYVKINNKDLYKYCQKNERAKVKVKVSYINGKAVKVKIKPLTKSEYDEICDEKQEKLIID